MRDFDSFIVRMVDQVLDLPAEVFARAALVRAEYGFATPDAIHLAAAVEGGCSGFLTNDGDLTCSPDLDVIVLPDSE